MCIYGVLRYGIIPVIKYFFFIERKWKESLQNLNTLIIKYAGNKSGANSIQLFLFSSISWPQNILRCKERSTLTQD